MKQKRYQVKLNSKPTPRWDIFEVLTEQVVTAFEDQSSHRATATARFLNGGNGFNGWTPQFFLRGMG